MPRPMSPLRAGFRLASPVVLVIFASVGCDPASLDVTNVDPANPFTLLSAPLVSFGDTFSEVESNNEFASANTVAIGQAGAGTITAALDSPQDIDVFDVGTGVPGDQIVVTVHTSPGMSVAVGVFDGQNDLLQYVTRISGSSPMYFETVCRATTMNLYIVVSSTVGTSSQGSYSLEIRRSAGDAPAVTPQVILLNFDGASSVSIGGGPAVQVPPFDAARISAKFAGQTAIIRQKTLEGVRAAFAGLNVTVRSSGEFGATDGVYTTVHFGTYNVDLLGLADSVDAYNNTPIQSAIVFTDTFALFTPLNPSVDEISQALANVAAHEAGHLLGLWHVTDVTDLMDITATARQMLRPQFFGHAKLHPTIAPTGWQSGPDLLAWAVGGNLKTDSSNQRALVEVDDGRGEFDFQIDRRLLSASSRQ